MTVSKLEPDPRKKGRWLLTLEDGAGLTVTDAEMADFALYAGMELDQKTHAAIKKAASARLSRERAMELVSVRPMSRAELLKKLGAGGGAASDHEAAADFLERAGLLNDADYAQKVCA
jgi:regulatory protein